MLKVEEIFRVTEYCIHGIYIYNSNYHCPDVIFYSIQCEMAVYCIGFHVLQWQFSHYRRDTLIDHVDHYIYSMSM